MTRGRPPKTTTFQNAFPHHKIIIAHLGKTPQDYINNFKEIKNYLFPCPLCNSITHINQIKLRACWGNEIQQKIFQIQVICTNSQCGKTHAVIPDFLCPYKRYINEVIENELNENSISKNKQIKYSSGAEESTVRRWLKWFKKKYAIIQPYLFKIIFERYRELLNILEFLSPYEQLKSLIRYSKAKGSGILGKANIELFFSEVHQFF